MKFSENWLRALVNPSCSSNELAHSLTMAGLEIEGVEPVTSVSFNKVVVAEVLAVEKHPQADRLNVCRVNVGAADNEPLQIVCGAPNVQVGMKVPCALVGAKLSDMAIKKAKLRGVESSGMLCSAKELGLTDGVDGLLCLPDDAPIGTEFRSYYELEDQIFELSLTPNRADCLGLLGVAREVAAITATDFSFEKVKPASCEISDTLAVEVVESEACPLYCGRLVKEVNVSVTTPLWISQRLDRSGIRSINAIVDITNYVMLEMGQPMHAFDLAKTSGSITVRNATQDERMQLLNSETITLTRDMLLIADEAGPLALAGIIGGQHSGVEQTAKDIFLESAFFNPDVISGKSFHLGFTSDSAHRFERGVDFAATRTALERATNLILSICGGKAGPVTEAKGVLPKRTTVRVRGARIKRVLGVDVNVHQVTDYFTRLGFEFTVDEDIFYVMPPTYRFDLAIEEDFIEEIARLYGYDNISVHLPRAGMAMLPESETCRSAIELKKTLVLRDYQEVINYSFVENDWETDLAGNNAPIQLQNPISSQLSVMRSSLIGGLLSNLQFNLNRKQVRVRLFELGCCFSKDKQGKVSQIEGLAGLSYGDAIPEQWGESARRIDFYDVKADVEALLCPKKIVFEANKHPAFHPGKSAKILYKNESIGWMGELHPNLQKKYDLAQPAVLFELHLDALLTKSIPVVKGVSKFPLVRRDIAILVDNHVSVHTLIASMLAENISIVSDISLFDVYRGKGVDDDKKSLAFRVLLQDTEKTLMDEDVDLVVKHLVGVLEKNFGAELRM